MNNSQYGDNQSVSSHFQQNQTHSLSQRHLTQTQIRTTLASQTQQPSYLPSNQHSQLHSQQQSDDGSVLGAQIMNFSIEEIREGYKKFLLEFEGQRQVQDQTQMEEEQQERYEFTYREKMNNMKDSGDFFLMINADHLRQYNQDIYKRMINFPGDIIPILDSVSIDTYQELRKAMREQGLNQESDQEIFSDANKILVGIYNLRHSKRIRDISPKDINKLISIKGIVIRVSSIFPEMRQAAFQCTQCQLIVYSTLQQGRVDEPNSCQQCRGKFTYQIKHNLCVYTDKQYVKIQENPEQIPDGETPQSNTLVAYDTNVDYVKPGDRIECVGVLRAQGIRKNKQQRTLKSVYNTFIDVISYSKASQNRVIGFGEQSEEQTKLLFTEQQKEIFHQIADSPKCYDILVQSLAPSIWENEDVKKGILTQLFGGTPKNFQKTGKGRFRAEINCLLLGDPSVAKSQLLQYVHNIAPRGVYTSGKGSSAVGLTAYITKDPETGEIVLESGALVLSDLGICCIDEFDKMDDNTRSILLEAMEQQTISIAKAGIVAQLNARTAVLAAANPIESKYNPQKSVIENINLSAPLLSRFDLIYILLDSINEKKDEVLCQHILNLYTRKEDQIKIKKNNDDEDKLEEENNEEDEEKQIISKEIFAQYVSYARNQIKPKLSDEAVQALQKEYCELRKQGQSRNVIVCTTRQLESAIRLAEGQAKMRLRNIVTKEDVEEGFRLIKVATQMAATDPTTGIIDIDLITTGRTTHSRENINKIQELLLKIFESDQSEYKKGVKYRDLYDKLKVEADNVQLALKNEEIELALQDMLKSGQINQTGHQKQMNLWTIFFIGSKGITL